MFITNVIQYIALNLNPDKKYITFLSHIGTSRKI